MVHIEHTLRPTHNCSVCRSRVIFFEEVKTDGKAEMLPLYRKFGMDVTFCSSACSTLWNELYVILLSDESVQKWLDKGCREWAGETSRSLTEKGKTLAVLRLVKQKAGRGEGFGVDSEDGGDG